MEQIRLSKIKITNFKGIREFEADFGQTTTIAGANATGKTSVMDAFLWTLFGKDSQDRTDSGRGAFGIKTVDGNGKVIEKLDHQVTVYLTTNSGKLELTRRLSEKWVKKARAEKPTMDGNTTTCIWNGVEIGVNEWNKRIEEHIMPIGLFKMLTNPHYFCNLPWTDQLETLKKMTGEVTPEDIAKGNPAFEEVLKNVGVGNNLGDRVTTIATELRRMKQRQAEIPSEIKGIKSATPEEPDYGELECEKNALMAEAEKIDAALSSEAEAERQHFDAIKAKQHELNTTENEMNQVYAAELAKANERVLQQNEAYNEAEMKLRMATQKLGAMDQRIQDVRRVYASDRDRRQEEITRLESKREELLKRWEETNAKEYVGGMTLICPMLGIACDSAKAHARHAEDENKARQAFNEEKNKELDQIERQGSLVREHIDQANEDIAHVRKDFEEADRKNVEEKEGLMAEYESCRQAFAQLKKADMVTRIDKTTIPEYMELHCKAEALRAEIAQMGSGQGQPQDSERAARKAEIRARLDQIAAELAKEDIIKDNAAKVSRLETEADQVAQQMADLEKEQDTIKSMQRAVVDEVESRVNKKFSHVKFRTCDWQINGEPVPTCYATLDGVRYSDLNSAGQINAGLDIINALCRDTGMTAPIFIDNAEGVNSLLETESQQIRLTVTTGKKLTVKIEEDNE